MEQNDSNCKTVSKKQYFLTVAFLLLLMLTLFFSLYNSLNERIERNTNSIKKIDIPVFNQSNNSNINIYHKYLLKEYDGILAVYKDNDLQYTVDIYVFTLPEADKKLLSQGIEVSSEHELNDIISSYY